MQRVGILGVGMHLPPDVRTNDWWPADAVAEWMTRPRPPLPTDLSGSAAAIVAAIRGQTRDPFLGAVRRHVAPPGSRGLDLEVLAARDAIARAAVATSEIDLVLTSSAPDDYRLTNSACTLHEALGLEREAFSLHVDGAQHAFLLQLALAKAMIVAGEATIALLVQSSVVTRLLDPRDPGSPFFGDGATAVVLGGVPADRGILAAVHRTDGSTPNALIASVPNARWYDEGRALLHIPDESAMQGILLRTVDMSREGILAALAACGHLPKDVDVFLMHQGMPWLRQLVQEYTGLEHARTVDTFADTAHLFGAFLPSTLVAARDRGVLREGDLVVLAGGGNGMTYGAAVLRWGPHG